MDYDRPDTLDNALDGVDRLLLISGSETGTRRRQHRAVIDAAKRAGVGLVAYTSILHADTTPLGLAHDHRDTELALAESGLPFVLLRNGWYTEVYTWRLPAALKAGALAGTAGDGRISSAARADYAAAAAVVLLGDGHAGRCYELAGDRSFTMRELAAAAGDAAGRVIRYQDMTPQAFKDAAIQGGVPADFAAVLADIDAGVSRDALHDESRELSRLIGRPTTPFEATIGEFFRIGSA